MAFMPTASTAKVSSIPIFARMAPLSLVASVLLLTRKLPSLMGALFMTGAFMLGSASIAELTWRTSPLRESLWLLRKTTPVAKMVATIISL